MQQLGIDPPPRDQFIQDERKWRVWSGWLQRLRQATPKVQTFSQTLNPTSVSANTTSEQTFTVTGLTTTDIVSVNKPSHQAGLGIVNCRVSAADTLAITFMNTTAGAIDPVSEDYLIKAVTL